MRTFYIFNIKKEMSILTHDTPYNLYRTIESLYYLDNINLGLSYKLYDQIFDSFDKDYMNVVINRIYQNNNYYYQVLSNYIHHSYYNVY